MEEVVKKANWGGIQRRTERGVVFKWRNNTLALVSQKTGKMNNYSNMMVN
jgi:hypothetical protein